MANALEFLGLDRAFFEEHEATQDSQGVGHWTEESEDAGPPPSKQAKLVA